MADENGNTIPLFLSTPSARRATLIVGSKPALSFEISIHALRGEGDISYYPRYYRNVLISIHALRGEGDTSTVNSS